MKKMILIACLALLSQVALAESCKPVTLAFANSIVNANSPLTVLDGEIPSITYRGTTWKYDSNIACWNSSPSPELDKRCKPVELKDDSGRVIGKALTVAAGKAIAIAPVDANGKEDFTNPFLAISLDRSFSDQGVISTILRVEPHFGNSVAGSYVGINSPTVSGLPTDVPGEPSASAIDLATQSVIQVNCQKVLNSPKLLLHLLRR